MIDSIDLLNYEATIVLIWVTEAAVVSIVTRKPRSEIQGYRRGNAANSFFEFFRAGHSMMNPSLEKLATSAETCLNDVRESLRNVRHLHLDVALTAEVLDHFLGLMPNATAFFLRSDLDTDSWEVPTTLLKANHTFTKLDLQLIYLVDEDLMDLVTKCSESLEELLVDGSFFTFEGCSAVGDFKKLRHLFLENAGPFDDDHLAKLFRNNPDLETLDIRKKNSLTGASLGQLPDLRRFRRLSLRHCDYISNEALCGLGRLDTLEHLDLVGTWWGSHISYLESFTSLRDLRSLKLDFEINSEGLDLICETFRKLETLHLESCGELTDADGLKFRLMEHLKDLRISYCSRFSDSAFEKGLGSPAMENLKVGSISLTDTGLAHIAAHHGRLEKLTLTGCKKVTDAGLASILRRGRHLRKLRLDDCPSISTGCPEELENFCPRLRSLKISRTPMQSQAFDLFRRRRPFVDVKFRA